MSKTKKEQKVPRILTCVGCGKEVRVGRYMGTVPYKCHICRHPEVIKFNQEKK